MLVHFFNTSKAYIIILRVASNKQLTNLFFSLNIIIFFLFSTTII